MFYVSATLTVTEYLCLLSKRAKEVKDGKYQELQNSASSIHWLSSSIFNVCSLPFVPHSNISTYLHYMMF